MEDRTRVLVIGLDGATWNVIQPLVKAGKLPTIEKLMNDGCYGDLESCIPHLTFPAWKCYSTGKNPGKLGAYWTFGVDMATERMVLQGSNSFKSKELWDYLGENNTTCGVLDMPTTYPPRKINGFMVSHGAPKPSGYAYPQELESELEGKFGYKINPDYFFGLGKEAKDATISSIEEIINQRFDVARYLLKKFAPSFFHMTIFEIDSIQHHCWREMEEGDAKYGKVIEHFWTLIDNRIKGLLDEAADEKTCIILMSDHGFTAQKGEFQSSKWLIERDLLKLKKPNLLLSGLLFRLGLSRANVLSVVVRTKMLSMLRLCIPKEARKKIVSFFPAGTHFFGPSPPGGAIDWGNSRVIPLPPGLLYINGNSFDSQDEYGKFKESLILEIKKIQDPRTGERLAREVYSREELYFGEYVDSAPDIVILPTEGYTIASAIHSRQIWNYPTQGWSGAHKLHGIFLAHGPDIKKGVEIQGAKIYDLAPTILHIHGTRIPKDMDGRVMKEIFEADSVVAKRNVEYQEADESARVRQKIKELKAKSKI